MFGEQDKVQGSEGWVVRVQGSWGWGSGFKVRSRACLEQNKVKGSQAERRCQGSGGKVPQSYLISEFLCPILSLFLAFHTHTHRV